MEFRPFPKIARLNRGCTITEKIDGSNAQVTIVPLDCPEAIESNMAVAIIDGFAMFAGSRNRWLLPTKSKDNFGFAGWVADNAPALMKLGEGSHYGEWWGSGIQRGYDLPKHEKRFSLFNVNRWKDDVRPACCHVVPTLYEGQFSTSIVDEACANLRAHGSEAAPGFMKAEGLIVYHHAQKNLFKVMLENDDVPKGMSEAA